MRRTSHTQIGDAAAAAEAGKEHQGQRQQQPKKQQQHRNHGTVHIHTGLLRDVYQQTARWVSLPTLELAHE